MAWPSRLTPAPAGQSIPYMHNATRTGALLLAIGILAASAAKPVQWLPFHPEQRQVGDQVAATQRAAVMLAAHGYEVANPTPGVIYTPWAYWNSRSHGEYWGRWAITITADGVATIDYQCKPASVCGNERGPEIHAQEQAAVLADELAGLGSGTTVTGAPGQQSSGAPLDAAP